MPSHSPGTEREPYLEVQNVTKTFGKFVAVENVSLKVFPGELVCILGPSGCGKTTLLRIISGLEEQNTGKIYLRGKDISREPTSKRECGIVFQSYALFPNISAAQNVSYGLKKSGKSKAQIKQRVKEMLDLVGLGTSGQKYPAQLSGGQQQRVALARALAPQPKLLLLDEPLSALDAQVRVFLRAEIRELQQRLGITTVMVTHDQEEGLTMADRIVVMDAGRLMQCDTPRRIYNRPVDPFVAGFIGSMNFLENWQIVDSHTAQFNGFKLVIAEKKHAKKAGDKVTVAIRPEDINVFDESDTHRENTILTVVEHIEFRGSFYRLRLRVESQDKNQTPQILYTDIQLEVLDRFGIKKDGPLLAQLPAEHLLVF